MATVLHKIQFSALLIYHYPRAYNKMFQKMYADPAKVDTDICGDMWKELGISKEYVDKIKDKSREYMEDSKIMGNICLIYEEMLKEAKVARNFNE